MAWKGSLFRLATAGLDLALPRRPILPPEEGNEVLRSGLSSGRPFFFGRLGTTEAEVLGWHRRFWAPFHWEFPGQIKERAWNNGGFFPPTSANLGRLGEYFEKAVRNTDAMVGWATDHEARLRHDLAPTVPWVHLQTVEPYFFEHPWTQALRGKRVVVVHPFADQIVDNYNRLRKVLFANPDILPEFELMGVTTKLTLAGNTAGAESWFEIFEELKVALSSKDFDVALLGCGTYGMPLAHFVKTLGRSSVYVGGALQILFGIKGKRWETIPEVSRLFNEHWTNVLPQSRPENSDRVEGGCYW